MLYEEAVPRNIIVIDNALQNGLGRMIDVLAHEGYHVPQYSRGER